MKVFIFQWEYQQCVGGGRTYDSFKTREYMDVVIAENQEEAEKLLVSWGEYGGSLSKLEKITEIDIKEATVATLIASNHYRTPLLERK